MSNRTDSNNFAHLPPLPGNNDPDPARRPPSNIGWLGSPIPILPVVVLALVVALVAMIAVAGAS
jgi:hypothetical protein